VGLDDGLQPPRDLLEGFLPLDLPEAVGAANERLRQAIGIVVQLAERGALRAQVAAAPDIVGIGPDPGDAALLDLDRDASHRLAEGTGPQMGSVAAHRAASGCRAASLRPPENFGDPGATRHVLPPGPGVEAAC